MGALSHRQRTPRSYRVCEGLTEGVLYFRIVFSPWAFGTTQDWSTWVMNVAGFLMGGLLMVKWWIRRGKGLQSSHAGGENAETFQLCYARGEPVLPNVPISKRMWWHFRWFTPAAAILTILFLAYCLISALNARGSYDYAQRSYQYYDHYVSWLPHSYDRASTWFKFWEYLGLALAFWAARDWLLGRSSHERHVEHQLFNESFQGSHPEKASLSFSPNLPGRLRRLLWVLCINGTLLGIEGILQRVSQSNKLLWLLVPKINTTAEAQFGPYAYRANAAQYFNLLWPVCLGFWWTLHRAAGHVRRYKARIGGSAHLLLLPFTVIMAICPIVSTSRGGAFIAIGGMMAAMFILLFVDRHKRWLSRLSVCLIFLTTMVLAYSLGWENLENRLKTMFSDSLLARMEIYKNSQAILAEYPLFGTGPGTFCTVYQWYREKPYQEWAAFAHNDWLETRITFGWVGFSMALLLLCVVLWPWKTGPGLAMPGVLRALFWLALAGCLAHAIGDFPLQVHSVLALFLLYCSVLSCVVAPNKT